MKNPIYLQNIKKFLFEVLIVALGILIAFNINKWDERRKLKQEEKEAYAALKKDLKSDLVILQYYKNNHTAGTKYLAPILEKNFNQLDSLSYYLQTTYDLQEGHGTYINLKYSGKLAIIRNEKINTLISLYYETYYQGLESLVQTHHKLVFDRVQPYMISNLKYDPTDIEMENALQKDQFLNLIVYQYSTLASNLAVFEKSEKLIKNAIKLIDQELSSKK